jgi:hypothetical protein
VFPLFLLFLPVYVCMREAIESVGKVWNIGGNWEQWEQQVLAELRGRFGRRDRHLHADIRSRSTSCRTCGSISTICGRGAIGGITGRRRGSRRGRRDR